MSIKDWPGGLITKDQVVPAGPLEDGAASGVWTLDQAANYTKQGIWPTQGQILERALIQQEGSSYAVSSLNLKSTGNAATFGNLTNSASSSSAVGSATRAVFTSDNNSNQLVYFTFATLGNSSNFGTIGTPTDYGSCGNSSTRGLYMGGWNSSNTNVSTMQYITIASLGNTLIFGYLSAAKRGPSGCSSQTRVCSAGGYGPPNYQNIEYVTTATTGSTSNFGNLTTDQFYIAAAFSSNTRGIWASGATSTGAGQTIIEYITIASTGNAVSFGSLAQGRNGPSGFSSATYGYISGGNYPVPMGGSNYDKIDYVTIASTGNSAEWGSLQQNGNQHMGAASNCNGGI